MASNFVVHVSETDFQFEVLIHSRQRPVVVDFWATWSVPCRTLDPILEKLTEEASGAFRLAKLDVDANPKIAAEYSVQGIPAVRAFRNGQVAAEFNGLRPEPAVREFLMALAPPADDLVVGRANSLLASESWAAAETLFREVLLGNPDQPGALLGLARSLLAQGQAASTLPILREFPASKEYGQAETLLPLARALADLQLGELELVGEESQDAAFLHALRLASRGKILQALDGLLDVLRATTPARKEQARKVFLGLLQVLGEENPNTRDYRSELATLLF